MGLGSDEERVVETCNVFVLLLVFVLVVVVVVVVLSERKSFVLRSLEERV